MAVVARPPDAAFDTPALRGKGPSKPWWFYPLCILAVFGLMSVIAGVASALRGGNGRDHDTH